MAESISIVMKMTDDISSTMRSIASSSVSVSKQFEEMQRKAQQLGSRYDALNKKAASTSAEALKVKKAMDEAAKTFKKSGEDADKVKFENLKQEYAELTDASKGYSTAAKETIRDINEVHSAMKKLQSGGSGSGGGSSGGVEAGLGGALAQAGLTKELADSVSGAIGAWGTSLVGQPIATMVSSTLFFLNSGLQGVNFSSTSPSFLYAAYSLV